LHHSLALRFYVVLFCCSWSKWEWSAHRILERLSLWFSAVVLLRRYFTSIFHVVLLRCSLSSFYHKFKITIASVANHQNVLPISCLIVVSLCIIFLNPRHHPLSMVAISPPESTQSFSPVAHHRLDLVSAKDLHHSFCCFNLPSTRPLDSSSHNLSDCSLALYRPDSWIHTIFPCTLSPSIGVTRWFSPSSYLCH